MKEKSKQLLEEIINALKLAQNQLAADRYMCSEDEAELWDVYQNAINKAIALSVLIQ